MRTTTLLLAALPTLTQATYVLDTVMWGSTFFSHFNFQTVDPNNGYVKYLTQAAAQAAGIIFQGEGAAVRIGTDVSQTLSGAAGTGRESVRIESTKTWNHGLYVYNLASMPVPACGTWPARKFQKYSTTKQQTSK